MDFAEAAIWIALDYLGLLDPAAFEKPLSWARSAFADLPMRERMFEVTYRHELGEDAAFAAYGIAPQIRTRVLHHVGHGLDRVVHQHHTDITQT